MKKPNVFLHITLGFLIKLYAYFKGQRIAQACQINGPAIILSNHTSFYDFIYTSAAMYPKRVSYLAAKKMFYEPVTGFFLRLARAIPKHLMQADPVATLKAFRILKKNGIISIFPEGQISPSGRFLTPAYAIAKFLKKARVDVYIVKHSGAGLSNPPWSKNSFKGRIETIKALIITKTELEHMSTDDIYQSVYNNLFHSESAYNMLKKNTYNRQDISNLENVIYQCPSCLHEGLYAKYDQLICPKCNHTLTYDTFGLLNHEGIDTHFLRQEARVRHAIDQDLTYDIQGHAKLMSFRNKRLVCVGSGILSIKRFKYHYVGTVDSKAVTLTFDVHNIPSLPSDIGRNVQIYEGDDIYQFEMDTPWLPTKMVHVGEYLYGLYKNENT